MLEKFWERMKEVPQLQYHIDHAATVYEATGDRFYKGVQRTLELIRDGELKWVAEKTH